MGKFKDMAIDKMNENMGKRICPKDIKIDDEICVEFVMKVNHIAGKDDKCGQVFGFTEDGMCVSAPIRAIVERCPRTGNGGEETDQGEVF
jgi:hypothetical protein